MKKLSLCSKVVAALFALAALAGFMPNSNQTPQVFIPARQSLGSVINTPTVVYTASSTASFTGSITGNIMTVSAVASGTLAKGQVVSGGTAPAVITNQLPGGSPGGVGTYFVSVPQAVAGGTSLSASGNGAKIVGCTVTSSDSSTSHVISVVMGGIPQTSFTIPAAPGAGAFLSVPCFITQNWAGLTADGAGNQGSGLNPGETITFQFATAIGTGNIYASLIVGE